MIKKELLKMPKLRATPYMLRRAKADKPKDVRVNKYTNWSYLRCYTKKGILKVSFFMTEAMRYGGTKPIKVIKERLDNTIRVLRLEEFAELDENNILIHGGELRGIRLVDVLMKDLLEAA